MKKSGVCILAILLAAGFSVQALAAPNFPPLKPRPGLTQAQIDKMKADRDAKQAAMLAQRDQMKSLSDQLRAELKKKPADQARIKSLRNQMDLQRDTVHLRMMQDMQNNPSLKPADKQRYNDTIQKIKERIARKQTAK